MKIRGFTLVAVLLSLMVENVMAVEEAKYTVSVKQDKLEVREYACSIVAEVIVNGKFEDASSAAFRTLFKYISGKNTAQSKIAMTSPVGQRKSDQGWVVSFMMPASYTMDTIPVPDDASVVLREIPAHRAAAIRYSGVWSENAYKKQLSSLREWMKSQNLEPAGEPVWARYNAPFTPWFMRRNEILIPIAP